MTCPRQEELVFLHAHGQLARLERLAAENHLESCEYCRSRWARWVAERDALRRAFAPVAELDGRAGIRMMEAVGSRIRQEPQLPPQAMPSLPDRVGGWWADRRGSETPAGGLPWLVIPVGETDGTLAPTRPVPLGPLRRKWLVLALAALLALGVSALAANWGPLSWGGGLVPFSSGGTGEPLPPEGLCHGTETPPAATCEPSPAAKPATSKTAPLPPAAPSSKR